MNPSRSKRRRTCLSKRKHATREDAIKARDLQNKICYPLKLNIYRCGICGGWHLTGRKSRYKLLKEIRRLERHLRKEGLAV